MLVPQVTESKVSPGLTIQEASNDLAVVSTVVPVSPVGIHTPIILTPVLDRGRRRLL
jgi:hypothetical protein